MGVALAGGALIKILNPLLLASLLHLHLPNLPPPQNVGLITLSLEQDISLDTIFVGGGVGRGRNPETFVFGLPASPAPS